MIEGDENARFSAVVIPHLSDALTMAVWLTGDRADAEDVVQDACLRAFRAIDTYAGGSSRAWVLSIVRNTAYTWLQKNRRAEVVALGDFKSDAEAESGIEMVASNDATPEAQLIAKVEAEQFRVAIERLSPAFRETIVLRDIQGLEYREIAQVTGMPLGTVMSRLARARRQLIKALVKEI